MLTLLNSEFISLAPLLSSLIRSKGVGGSSVGLPTIAKVNKSVVVVFCENKIVRKMEGVMLYTLLLWFIKLG